MNKKVTRKVLVYKSISFYLFKTSKCLSQIMVE